jgi:Flp pilus assembly protein TadD
MLREAEFAYRQALALGPGNSEAVSRYAELLISQNRSEEAKTLLQTSLAAVPGSPKLSVLLKSLVRE